MNTTLWVIQGLLSLFFFMTGFGKARSSIQKHIDDGHLHPGQPVEPLRVLGTLEILGSLGIVVPWLSGIAIILTPITAICFCLIMVGAMVVHIQKKQYKFLPLPVVVIILALVVAYYRFSSGTTV